MRIWHVDLIDNGLLPQRQLTAQWRELGAIFSKQDRHILINYVYEYDKSMLAIYTLHVLEEMERRNFSIMKFDNFNKYFPMNGLAGAYDYASMYKRLKYFINKDEETKFNEHNDRYLVQCFYNLQEKFIRGQKDFKDETYEELVQFMFDKGLGGYIHV